MRSAELLLHSVAIYTTSMLKPMLTASALSCMLMALVAPLASQAPNTLNTEEKRAGWRLLFDGTSMDQWRGYQRPDAAGLRWVVTKDGCLGLPPADGADTRGSRDIITREQFGDFELTWEWRVSEGGNSGVKYFVTEKHQAAIGHEYQIIDDAKHPDAAKRDNRRTASFYDVLAAPDAKANPAGQFNKGRILVRGTEVEHWLNGQRVLQYTLDSEPLRRAVADSKFKDTAGFGTPQRGHILLQDHGDAVCYKNIKVRTRPGNDS
jgi:hypothetical protein